MTITFQLKPDHDTLTHPNLFAFQIETIFELNPVCASLDKRIHGVLSFAGLQLSMKERSSHPVLSVEMTGFLSPCRALYF